MTTIFRIGLRSVPSIPAIKLVVGIVQDKRLYVRMGVYQPGYIWWFVLSMGTRLLTVNKDGTYHGGSIFGKRYVGMSLEEILAHEVAVFCIPYLTIPKDWSGEFWDREDEVITWIFEAIKSDAVFEQLGQVIRNHSKPTLFLP